MKIHNTTVITDKSAAIRRINLQMFQNVLKDRRALPKKSTGFFR
jgi:hypothetical protein